MGLDWESGDGQAGPCMGLCMGGAWRGAWYGHLIWIGDVGRHHPDCSQPHKSNITNPNQMPIPCTTPCTTHAPDPCMAQLARHHIPNPTPPNRGAFRLHGTAAAWYGFNLMMKNKCARVYFA